ncbi:uncharacterized protein LOC122279516 [Carya illinoinensis]|uniref:uncharacterized protein LOC122279516 n=1 Tax=Carya illinoinensis TaxID=32201 RepID=UPI001C724E8F|nr:uncharacterized protein LOC122279516 [Carya illinoinensis]
MASLRKKWRAWDELCRPVLEGGIGLRNLLEAQRSLHMKFVWNLFQGKSVWSKFLVAKYVGNNHISCVDSSKGSKSWKMLLDNMAAVKKFSKWRVKECNISFWQDRWLNDGPLSEQHEVWDFSNLSIAECKLGNGWNVELFDRLVGMEKLEQILEELGRVKQGKDTLIWLPNAHGNFSPHSAWECIRSRGPKVPSHKWLWHPALPKKMSLIMWKTHNNCLPVDDRVRRAGISLVSKCDCCDNGGYED